MNLFIDGLPIFLRLGASLAMIDPTRLREYLGPETVMPLASILAAVAGFFLLFWRLIVKYVKKAYRKIRGLPEEVPPDIDDLPPDEPLSVNDLSGDE